jgi:hypothetical protein
MHRNRTGIIRTGRTPPALLRKVVSAGDLVILLGIALLAMAATSARPPPPAAPARRLLH